MTPPADLPLVLQRVGAMKSRIARRFTASAVLLTPQLVTAQIGGGDVDDTQPAVVSTAPSRVVRTSSIAVTISIGGDETTSSSNGRVTQEKTSPMSSFTYTAPASCSLRTSSASNRSSAASARTAGVCGSPSPRPRVPGRSQRSATLGSVASVSHSPAAAPAASRSGNYAAELFAVQRSRRTLGDSGPVSVRPGVV